MQFTAVKKASKLGKLFMVLLVLIVLGFGYCAWQFYSMFGFTMPSLDKVKEVFIKTKRLVPHERLPDFFIATQRKPQADISATKASDNNMLNASDAGNVVNEQKSSTVETPTTNSTESETAATSDGSTIIKGLIGSRADYVKIRVTTAAEAIPSQSSANKKTSRIIAKKYAFIPKKNAAPTAVDNKKAPPLTASVPTPALGDKSGQDLRSLLQTVQRTSETQQVQRMQRASAKITDSPDNNVLSAQSDHNVGTTSNINYIQEPAIIINNDEAGEMK